MAKQRSTKQRSKAFASKSDEFAIGGDKKLILDYKVDVTNSLGKGAFGVVYKCEDAYGHEAAVKQINLHHIAASGSIKTDVQEILKSETLSQNIRHRNICTILDCKAQLPDIWIFMEYCPYDLVKYHDHIDKKACKLIILQCVYALDYLHSKNIVHRDIKPDNILLKIQHSIPVVKVTDFSLARDLTGFSDSYMSTVRGNTYWLAPELLHDNGERNSMAYFKKAVDLFILGLVAIFISVTKKGHEIARNKQLGVLVKSGTDIVEMFAGYWRHTLLTEELHDDIQALLSKEAYQRPMANVLASSLQQKLPDTTQAIESLNMTAGEDLTDSRSSNEDDVSKVSQLNTNSDPSQIDDSYLFSGLIKGQSREMNEERSYTLDDLLMKGENYTQNDYIDDSDDDMFRAESQSQSDELDEDNKLDESIEDRVDRILLWQNTLKRSKEAIQAISHMPLWHQTYFYIAALIVVFGLLITKVWFGM